MKNAIVYLFLCVMVILPAFFASLLNIDGFFTNILLTVLVLWALVFYGKETAQNKE